MFGNLASGVIRHTVNMKRSLRVLGLQLLLEQFSWRVKNLALRSKLDISSCSAVRDDTIIPGMPSQLRAGSSSFDAGSVVNFMTQTLKNVCEDKLELVNCDIY